MQDDPEFLSATEVFESPKFTVIQEVFRLASGETVQRSKLNHTGASVIVPKLKDGSLVLIEQYRYALKKRILEFPAGTIDNQEPHLTTAIRELKEEIGGKSKNFTHLGSDYSTPGFTDELLHSYLATDVEIGSTALELGELVTPKIMIVTAVEQAIADGRICDMKSIVAFFRAKALGLI